MWNLLYWRYLLTFKDSICCGRLGTLFITVRNEVAKVMFLQVSVCPRGGGACNPAYLQVVSQHALQQASRGCLFRGGWLLPRGVPARGGGVETPCQQTATVVDGTHPTGMHSCLD